MFNGTAIHELNRMIVINRVSRIDSLMLKVYRSIHLRKRKHYGLLNRLNEMSIEAHDAFRIYVN